MALRAYITRTLHVAPRRRPPTLVRDSRARARCASRVHVRSCPSPSSILYIILYNTHTHVYIYIFIRAHTYTREKYDVTLAYFNDKLYAAYRVRGGRACALSETGRHSSEVLSARHRATAHVTGSFVSVTTTTTTHARPSPPLPVFFVVPVRQILFNTYVHHRTAVYLIGAYARRDFPRLRDGFVSLAAARARHPTTDEKNAKTLRRFLFDIIIIMYRARKIITDRDRNPAVILCASYYTIIIIIITRCRRRRRRLYFRPGGSTARVGTSAAGPASLIDSSAAAAPDSSRKRTNGVTRILMNVVRAQTVAMFFGHVADDRARRTIVHDSGGGGRMYASASGRRYIIFSYTTGFFFSLFFSRLTFSSHPRRVRSAPFRIFQSRDSRI